MLWLQAFVWATGKWHHEHHVPGLDVSGLSLGGNKGGSDDKASPQALWEHVSCLFCLPLSQSAFPISRLCIGDPHTRDFLRSPWDHPLGEWGRQKWIDGESNCCAVATGHCSKLRQEGQACMFTLPLTCLGWRLPPGGGGGVEPWARQSSSAEYISKVGRSRKPPTLAATGNMRASVLEWGVSVNVAMPKSICPAQYSPSVNICCLSGRIWANLNGIL